MSFLSRIFSKKKEDDFETVLASLTSDIQKRQVKLSEIRLREKRSTLLSTVYTLLAWLIYTSLWYWNALPPILQPNAGRHVVVERTLYGLPVFVGPIIILFIRRIVQVWYTRKANAEEKTLQNLMKRRRTKVEEIKKKTNFDSMVRMFQEYDEPSPGATPLRKRLPLKQPPVTPQHQVASSMNSQRPVPTMLQAQLTPIPNSFPMAPPRKRWYDKFADALLGDDDHDIGSPSSRYALICEKCFTHNGLIKESMWEDAQFICRNQRCGYLNRSARSKRQALSLNVSPLSAISSPSESPNQTPVRAPPSPLRRSPAPNKSPTHDSNPDAPTVDSIDAGMMEVDS